eukprot:6111622-Amphidinium_carterae.1
MAAAAQKALAEAWSRLRSRSWLSSLEDDNRRIRQLAAYASSSDRAVERTERVGLVSLYARHLGDRPLLAVANMCAHLSG